MAQEWIIDVLADLRQYAVRNYHFRLAEQLDDAIVVAAVELRAADSLDAEVLDALQAMDAGGDSARRGPCLALVE